MSHPRIVQDLTTRTSGIKAAVGELLRFNELSQEEFFATEGAAKAGITFKNTSDTEPLVCLRYFGPEVNPDAPAMGAYKNA